MKKGHQRLAKRLMTVVPAIILSLQFPLSAKAGQSIALSAEAPVADTSVSTNTGTKTTETLLKGRVKKIDQGADPAGANPASQTPVTYLGDVKETQPGLELEKTAVDPDQAFKLATQKLRSGAEMTSQDYRDLGAGTVGMETDRTYFTDRAKVSDVYKGSPAEEAGFKKGDIIIDHADDSFAKEDPTVPRWFVSVQRAGTPMNVIRLRHGKQEAVTLIRMNVEDIQSDSIRHEWEKILRSLGNPESGQYEIDKP